MKCKKSCTHDKICNTKTGRCVLRIWIKKRDNTFMKIRYIIDDISYNIKTNMCCRIYDFDRAYAFKLKGNLLNKVNCSTNSHCNYISNCKDFVKVICGIYKVYNTLGETLIDLIIPNDSSSLDSSPNQLKLDLLQSFKNSCNLTIQQGGFEYSPFDASFYKKLNTYPVILQKIYDNISQSSGSLNNNLNTFTEEPDFTFICNKKSFSPNGNFILQSKCCSDD